MSLYRGPDPAGEGARQESATPPEAACGTVEGERTIPSINRARSLQSRVSSVLALGLMSAVGLALLVWYYSGAITRQSRALEEARDASAARAKGEMPLPPLGRIEPPSVRSDAERRALEDVLGPRPELPSAAADAWRSSDARLQSREVNTGTSVPKTPEQLALERRLAGTVFARSANPARATPTALSAATATAMSGSPMIDARESGGLSDLLEPVSTPAVAAQILPTRQFLLGKGAFIDCTLETAIDSTLPGMVTCITATDTFGSDGRIVLLERGTKLVGETRGQVQQGMARLFVLWTEARTPTGIVVPLASPGTDELGRAGLPGAIDRHFWDRFGAAILMSIVNGAVQGAAQSGSKQGTIIVNPSTSSDVMTEVLRSTIAIPPTIRKPQGDRIQVLVARDLDFRSVYELHTRALVSPAQRTP